MKERIIVALIIGFGFLSGTLFAQEVRWSQYYIVMPAINPAATGAFGGDYRIMANYRMNQYSGAAQPFTTIYAAYDQGIKKHQDDGSAKNTFFALGLSFMQDQAGIGSLTSTEISPMFSFNMKVAEQHFISIGAKMSYATRSVDYTSFKWSTQFNRGDASYDPNLPTDPLAEYESVNYFPIGVGLMWNFSNPDKLKMNAGLAVNRINEPDVAFDPDNTEPLPMQMNANLGVDWYIPNTIISLMPLFLYQSQAYYSEMNVGLFAKWHLSFDSKMTHIKKTSILYTGFFYRSNGDMVLSTKLDLRRNLTFGLSFDTGLGEDDYSGRSAIELSIIYRGFFMEKSMIPKKASTEFFN